MGLFGNSSSGQAKKLRDKAKSNPQSVSVDKIEDYLSSDDPTARSHAAAALDAVAAENPDAAQSALDSLKTLLADDHMYAKEKAAAALSTIAASDPASVKPALDDIQELLSDDYAYARANAASVLKIVADWDPRLVRSALDDIKELVTDEQAEVRTNAISVLAAVAEQDPEAVSPVIPTLVTCLVDDDETVQDAAETALGVLASKGYNVATSIRTFKTQYPIVSSPTVVDGTVYISSFDERVYAIDAEAWSKRWTFEINNLIGASCAVSGDTVYTAGDNRHVYALDINTGSKQWSSRLKGRTASSPTVEDGMLYIGDERRHIYAIDTDTGEKQWTLKTAGAVVSSPTVVDDTIYIGSDDQHIYALHAKAGEVKWTFQTDHAVVSSPTVVNDTVYVGSADQNVYAIDANSGTETWSFTTDGHIQSSPTVVNDTVFIGSDDHHVYAIDAQTGSKKWSFDAGSSVSSSPTIADGTVFVGCNDHRLYAIDADTGDEQWAIDIGSSNYMSNFDRDINGIQSSPTVVNGTVFIGSWDSRVYAVDTSLDNSSEGSRVDLGTLGHHDAQLGDTQGATSSQVEIMDIRVVRRTSDALDIAVDAIANNSESTQEIDISFDDVETITKTCSVKPDQTTTVTASFEIPESLTEQIGQKYTLTAASRDDSDNIILNGPTFDVHVANGPFSVEAGDEFEPVVKVTNIGDISGKGTLEAELEGHTSVVTSIDSLASGETTTVDLSIDAPDVGDNEHDYRCIISCGNALTSVPVKVSSPPWFDIKIQSCPDKIEIGDTISLTAKVINRGDEGQTQPVELQLNNTEHDLQLTRLAPRDSTKVTFELDTEHIDSGTHEIMITTKNDTASRSLQVLQPSEFEISGLEIDEPVDFDDELDITTEITNIGGSTGTEKIELEVEGIDSLSRDITLDADDTETVNLSIPGGVLSGDTNITVSTPDDTVYDEVHIGDTQSKKATDAKQSQPHNIPPMDTVPDVNVSSVEYERLQKENLIGKGGNADVFRATVNDDEIESPLAVKEPNIAGTLHTETVDRIMSEADTWQRLDDHDHVVTVVDYGSNPLPWIAMELMDGGHLGERTDNINGEQALFTAIATTKAIRYAHRRGVAHLDLKPENILFRSVEKGWDIPKVADWGLSKRLLRRSKSIDGFTPHYAAPEQFDESFGSQDDITDIYQLGAVFYELFTGQPPFEGRPTKVMRAVINESPTPPSKIADIPPELDEILLTALAKEKDDRYETVVHLRDKLQRVSSYHI